MRVLKKIGKYFGRFLLVVLATVLVAAGTLYLVLYKICNGPSESAKATFVTTILETGQLKFLANWVCSKEEINAIVDQNKLKPVEVDINEDLIHINTGDNPGWSGEEEQQYGNHFDENGIELIEIPGRTYLAKLLIIKDPSQVMVGTTYPWSEYGKKLDVIVSQFGGVAGVNGGLYQSTGNKGGYPLGVVVSKGQIQYNSPNMKGLYLIGFNEDNLLVIHDMAGMSKKDVENFVRDEKIRDAVSFQEEASDANNHFVPLVINGEGRELNGQGSGSNPRTAIGQRADGAILLLVTDGRGANAHLGASAADLIGIMLDYGAVNAANIDGGSSSSMVYNGEYEMNSVTFYYQNSSWRLPTALVVLPKSGKEN